MEAWKFVDYSRLSPVYALGFTTERWGLEPFPGNLVAISGYWNDIKDSNIIESAWSLPYSCSSSDSSDYYYSYYTEGDGVDSGDYFYYYNDVTNISASTSICSEPQPCADSGCIILIEGIGKTTTGPANSSIVGLSHGISSFLIITLTIAVIMGCFGSSLSGPTQPEPVQVQLARDELRSYINPPLQRRGTSRFDNRHISPPQQGKHKYLGQAATPANIAKEVARCSDLLRQMYALDLLIWGMEGCVPDEVPKREERMHRANALFAEICRVVHNWKSRSRAAWSAEERQHVEDICRLVDQHNVRRYEV